jgi:2,4-dienoyl-CoA reductase-like NADH-dependent reductase (Old Yellow Enzyme family)
MPQAISYAPLFEPLEVRGRTFRNRIVMPPMVTVRDILDGDGRSWYAAHAAGGVAMVIVEATPLGLLIERNLEPLRALVEAIHAGGALAAIQLFTNGQWPTTTEFFESPRQPQELPVDELRALLAAFGPAARVCAGAGFDAVEVHGAHGYFLTRCFSPHHNRREDDYGGDLEGRMRAALEVCRAIRASVDDALLLLYRHTPVEDTEAGYGLADTIRLSTALVEAGVDVLDISPSHGAREGEYSEAVRLSAGCPVIARGELDEPDRALAMIVNDRADLVAVGRGLIADPEWPNKVRERRFGEIVRCIRCNEKCFGNLRRRIPIDCTQRRD